MIGSHLLITGMHIVRCSVFLGAIKIKENVNVNGRNEREQARARFAKEIEAMV